jgi:LmbE family N-acetylglucosaminyl deacetylase
MLGLKIEGLNRILCLGAHSDDIEIGCGATLLQLVKQGPRLRILWVVFSAEGARKTEAEASGRLFLKGVTNRKIIIHNFRGSFFPFQGETIKESFEDLKAMFQPNLIFTHYREDRHQDHRVISDLTWNTFRNHLILEYEIPKYDGDLGQPNCFVPVTAKACQKKISNLMRCFRTQRGKHWFSEDTFLSLMRLRGTECASPTRYAEAFYGRKLVLQNSH